MPTFNRNLRLDIEASNDDEADHKIRWIIDAIDDSDALPTDVTATVPHIDPDWLDDIENVRDADHVDVSWAARDDRGRVLFHSDMTLSADQAAGMFRGIGEAS